MHERQPGRVGARAAVGRIEDGEADAVAAAGPGGDAAPGCGSGTEAGAAALLSDAGGAAGSFQSGANGCLVLSFFETTTRALGEPATARSIESLVAS